MIRIGRTQYWRLLYALLLTMFLLFGCDKASDQAARIVLGQGMGVLNAPIFVTNKKDFWSEQSLNVQVRPFVAGRLALDSLIAGDIDVATIGDTPIVYGLFKHDNLRIIATVMESDQDEKVIARRDSGIQVPADLKGKRIGVFFGTAGEFYAKRFLEAAGLTVNDVTLINIKAPDMVAALSNGNIDAYASWEPHIQNGVRTLGDKAVVFRNPDIYTQTWNLVITENFFNSRPEAVRRILRAVIRGTEYTRDNSEEAIDITADNLGLNREVLKGIWGDYNFAVVLSKKLVSTLKDQGEWIQGSRDVAKNRPLPNYDSVIIAQPLRELLPSAVTID